MISLLTWRVISGIKHFILVGFFTTNSRFNWQNENLYYNEVYFFTADLL